jgi:PAS domain S-box-containing protein
MRDQLQYLSASLRSIDLATSSEQVVQALSSNLAELLPGAAITISLEVDGLLPILAQNAVGTQAPQISDNDCHVAIPMVVEGRVRGVVLIETPQPPTNPQMTAALALAQIAAGVLDRLSWQAHPRVFRQLVENSNVAIDVADLGGKITYANRAAASLYGFESPEQMIGHNVSELYRSDSEQLIATDLIFHAKSPEGWIGEVTHQFVDGTPFPVEIAVFGLHDPDKNMVSYGAIIQNMSEHHALLSSLQRHSRRMESLNRIGTLLSSSLDRNYIMSVAARQIVELLNIDHCSIVVIDETGQAADIVAEYPATALSTAKLPLVGNPIFEAHQTEEFFLSPDIATDKRLNPVRAVLEALSIRSLLVFRLEVKGKLIGSIGIDSIQRRRDFTSEEIEACRTLANQIGLAIENADLYAQAVEANKLKSQFLATMSHELRTPLNAIIGYTEMIMSGVYGNVSDKQQDRLQRVLVNSQQLLSMINDVLDLSRIESGQMPLSPEPLEVSPLIEGLIGAVGARVGAKRLQLKTDIPAGLPAVFADSGRLRQIVINLLSNAIKFTREGSITVRAYPLTVIGGAGIQRSVRSVDLPDGNWVAVSVEDTGIGISPENFDIIFDVFRQVDGSSVREFEGIGLGLAITRQLVELHGGRLWVESEIGRGSAFTFILPVAPEAETNAAQPQTERGE